MRLKPQFLYSMILTLAVTLSYFVAQRSIDGGLALSLAETDEQSWGSINLSSEENPTVGNSSLEANNTTSSIAKLISLIEQYQGSGSTISSAAPSCNGQWPCVDSLPDPKAEICNARNSYLEKEFSIAKRKFKTFQILDSEFESDQSPRNQIVNPRCIREAMDLDFFSKSNRSTFKSCLGKSTARAPRACLSKDYVNYTTSAFTSVAMCFRKYFTSSDNEEAQTEVTRNLFKMISHESGFHVNAFSSTGAGGLGQMTGGAIADLNRKKIPQARQFLSQQGGICETMAQDFLRSQAPMQSYRSSCDRSSVAQGNPFLNLIYSFSYFKTSLENIESRVFSDSNYASIFSNLSEVEQVKLKSSLAVWSHNTGASGLIKPLLFLLNRYAASGKIIRNVDQFLNELEPIARNHPHSGNSGVRRRIESSEYYRKVSSTLKKVETATGVESCFKN